MIKYRVKIQFPFFNKDSKIETNKDGLYFVNNLWIRPSDYPDCFEEIKEPLFVTYDGVELFNQDEIIYVIYAFKWFACSVSDAINMKDEIFLSSKQAAEKWIDENKPMFSKKQIWNIIHKLYDENKTYTNFITNFEKDFRL